MGLSLTVLPDRFAVCRLSETATLPTPPPETTSFWSLTVTEHEVSLVVPERGVPASLRDSSVEAGFRAIAVEGPLPFSAIGIMAGLSTSLARAGVSLLAISTFDTDYLLVRQNDLAKARDALTEAGHDWDDEDGL